MKYLFLFNLLLLCSTAPGQEALNALTYDGNNEFTTLGNPSNLQLTDYSIEVWFYSTDSTRSILTRGTSQGATLSRTFDLYGDGNSLILYLSSTNGSEHFHTIGSYSTNQWNHIAIIKKDSTITTFLNGSNPVKSDLSFTPSIDVHPWDIGGNGLFSHKGRIDELRIWSKTLSISKVLDRMHSQVPTYEWGLVGYYKFNETTGNTLPDLNNPSENGTNINMENSDWVLSYAPIGNSTSRLQTDQRSLWQSTGTNNSIESDGFWLNVGTPLSETNYAIYGHNNLARLSTIVSTDLPSGMVERYNQVWYVDEFGTVNSNITFDLDKTFSSPIVAGTASDYHLLFRTGTSGEFTDLGTASSIENSDEVTFSGISLADGYYTLGTSNTNNSPIKFQLDVGQSYFGINNYIEYIPGNLPIILVAPHGGSLEPVSLPVISPYGRDNFTLETTINVMDSIMANTNGFRPHVIINRVIPFRLNPAHDLFIAAGTHPDALQAWHDFHNFIELAKTQVIDTWGAGHYFEMHGNGHLDKWTEIGLGVSKTFLNSSDSVIMERINFSTVKNLSTLGGANFLEVIKGTNSLGSLLQAKGWKSVPSTVNPSPDSGGFFFAGWNTWRHGSRYSGSIDASHVENFYAFMQNDNREQYSSDLAISIIQFMNNFYGFTLNCMTLSTNHFDTNTSLVKIYPNPVNHKTTIEASKQELEKVIIFNLLGLDMTNKVNILNINETKKILDFSSLTTGLYFIITKTTINKVYRQ